MFQAADNSNSHEMELPYESYQILKGRFHLALCVIFLMITVTFGYFSVPTATDTKNYGTLLIIGVAVLFGLVKFLNIQLILNFKFSGILYFILGWMAILFFFRDDLGNSGKNFFNIFLTQVFIILLINILWQIPFDLFIKSLIIYFQIVLLACVFLHVKHGSTFELGNHNEEIRLGGLFFFGITGVLSGLGAVLSTFMYFKADLFKTKTFYLACFIAFLVYTLATDMRTVLSAIALGVFVQYFFRTLARRKSVVPVLFFAAMMYGLLTLYKSHSTGSTDVEKDLGVRKAIWGVASKLIKNEPLIGYGKYLETIEKVSMSDPMYTEYFKDSALGDPHSSFLSLLLQSGIITFGLFIYMLFRIGVNTRHYPVYSRALLSLIIFWLISGSTGGDFFDFTYTLRGILFEISMFGILLHPELMEDEVDED